MIKKIKEKEDSFSKIEKETQINRNLIYSDKFVRAIQGLEENKNYTRKKTYLTIKVCWNRIKGDFA